MKAYKNSYQLSHYSVIAMTNSHPDPNHLHEEFLLAGYRTPAIYWTVINLQIPLFSLTFSLMFITLRMSAGAQNITKSQVSGK